MSPGILAGSLDEVAHHKINKMMRELNAANLGREESARLAKTKNGLEDAHITLCGAVTAHAEAKRALELAEAGKLFEGVEGKNEAQRDARMRLELSAETTALVEAEGALAKACCAYENPRLEWDLLRYQVRAIEDMRDAA